MESVFMARANCRLSSPPSSQPHYYPTQPRTLTRDEKNICLIPARPHQTNETPGISHGNETTPTTCWHLQPMYARSRSDEEEEDESSMSSQYNECWKSSSTIETSRQMEEERGGEGGEGGGGVEGEGGESGASSNVDGATGQSTIAKCIERFRSAPPTPREGRRQHQSGGTGNFWWQGPPQNPPGEPPQNPPSPPLSHSTPTNTSSTSTTARQSSSDNRESHEDSLGERSQHALQRSSSLLAVGANGSLATLSHTHPATQVPRKLTSAPLSLPSLPLSLVPGGAAAAEEDILYQWRLRRRLEQARRHTARLTARLDSNGPLFKSHSLRARDSGDHAAFVAVGRNRNTEYPSPPLSHTPQSHLPAHTRECATDHPPHNTTSCQQCGQPAAQNTIPPLPHHPTPPLSTAPPFSHVSRPVCHPAQSHAPVAPSSHTPVTPSSHMQIAPSSQMPVAPLPWCVPPHRHTQCDIVPCAHCSHPLVLSPAAQQMRRGERRVEENTPQRKDETRGPQNSFQEDQDRSEGESLQPQSPLRGDAACPSSPHVASPAQPPVRYPSPSLLDHMRRFSLSHDNHHTGPHPHNEEEDTEVSPSLSETFLSDGTSTPANREHRPSPQCGIGDIVSQAVQQHLFQDGISADVSAAGVASEYDDMGDDLLKTLVSRVIALEQQMRNIRALLSAVEES